MSNYSRGRDFEWQVRDYLRENGYEVVRAAGSKTKLDLIAMKPRQLIFVQCKRSALPSPAERMRVAELAGMVGAVPAIARKVRGGVRLDAITGDGSDPKGLVPLMIDFAERAAT